MAQQQQQQPNLFQAQGTKKRLVMPHELSGKFRCREDFVKYFKEVRKYKFFCLTILFLGQFYVPKNTMYNKDFLKLVLDGVTKKLLKLKDVKFINVPVYDELSVKKFWPMM